jgi:low affinity Fe/Cu permease
MKWIYNFNQKIATKITSFVSTMWCAYIFVAIALISLPAAIKTGDLIVIIAWVAQTFLQLVLLSIIMVGQNASTRGMQQKIDETHTASLGEFELAKQSQEIANKEMAQLKEITSEIHKLIRDIEKRSK